MNDKILIGFILLIASLGDSWADGRYLGNLSANPYDADSTSNPYGRYGSEYSADSINNPYGRYGSPYSNESANNPYATNAPKLIQGHDGGVRIYGDEN
jgi:hypothetical protein